MHMQHTDPYKTLKPTLVWCSAVFRRPVLFKRMLHVTDLLTSKQASKHLIDIQDVMIFTPKALLQFGHQQMVKYAPVWSS